MSGCVIPRTPIAVDSWKRSNSQAKLFFLSHMHSDHTVSLNSSWKQTIYCSEITKSLAIEKFGIQPSLLVSIPIGQSTILNLDEIGVEKLTVTLFDANHCPGAVMFLFEGYFGRILYTGDFRYEEGILDVAPFQTNHTINTLYLDNTYCKPGFDFPTRIDSTLMILNIIDQHPNKDIVFGLDTLGKEDLLFQISGIIGLPIIVDKYRLHTTTLMGCNVGFTTDANASHVRVVPRIQVNKYTVLLWNQQHPTIAILPTCRRYIGLENPHKDNENIFVVPYSDHSTFSELKKFVGIVKPQQIVPVVQRSSKHRSDPRVDMSVFNGEKSSNDVRYFFDIPASVLNFMSQKTTNTGTFYQRNKRKSLSFFTERSKRPHGVVFLCSPKRGSTANKPIAGPTMIDTEEGVLVPITKANNAENCVSSVGKSTFIEHVGTVEGVCKYNEEKRGETHQPQELAACQVRETQDRRKTQEGVEVGLERGLKRTFVKQVTDHTEMCHGNHENTNDNIMHDAQEVIYKLCEVLSEGECNCECDENHEVMHDLQVSVKKEPGVDDHIMETNCAQREYEDRKESKEKETCIAEEVEKEREGIHWEGMAVVKEEAIEETETQDGLAEMSSKQQEEIGIHLKGMLVPEEAINETETQDDLVEMLFKQQEGIHWKEMPVLEEAIHETETQDDLVEMSSKQQQGIHWKEMPVLEEAIHETETQDDLVEMSSKQQQGIHWKEMPVLEEAIHETETQDDLVEMSSKQQEGIHWKGMAVLEEAIHETETQDDLVEMSSKQREGIHLKAIPHETETQDDLIEMSCNQQEGIHCKVMPVLEEAIHETETQDDLIEMSCNQQEGIHCKVMPVVEEAIHETETQDGLAVISSKQPEAALAAQTHEYREAPSERPNHQNRTLGDDSVERYCLCQTNPPPSNIYGGSCAFAWRVIQKLKSTRQSK